MDTSKEEVQRNKFRDILFELASNQELLKDKSVRAKMYSRLEALYWPEKSEKPFRHFYSDIFSVLTAIRKNTDLGDINVLGQNLSMIREKYTPGINLDSTGKKIDISDSIRKLYDHVSLDIARITYSEEGDKKTSGEAAILDVQSRINVIEPKIEEAMNVQNTLSEELGKQQREYIAILGIFASIVLTFIGGIVFSTSVLQNIGAVSVYRLAAIVLLIGMVLSNMLYGLFYYVNHLIYNNKKISATLIILANCLMLLMLALVFASWLFGVVERRNGMFG